jgi:hypothetical protein
MGRAMALGQLSLWNNPKSISEYLASQLKNNCLSLVLGAGVSDAFGLPNWDKLIKNMEDICGHSCSKSLGSAAEKADELRTILTAGEGGYQHYLDVVQQGLYKNVKDDFVVLNTRKTLDAIAALCIPSRRGSVKEIITFNFDNILETYLKYYGITSYSPISGNSWMANADVSIYHIHGLLPKNTKSKRSPGIVFDQTSYSGLPEYPKWEWAPKISSLLRSTTALFIGLSGEDNNLKNFIEDSRERHAYNDSPDRFWGVSFIRYKNDDTKMKNISKRWMSWGIFPCVIKGDNSAKECSHKQFENGIKNFLFSIAQEAADL